MCTENLALHQPAWQSSTWFSGTEAERAVDGQYRNLSVFGGQCAASWGVLTAEWWVDLGGLKNIHYVFIQHETRKSMLVILSFKITDCYLQLIDFKLIIQLLV